MSMDNYPQEADVVEVDFIKEMCPVEYAALEKVLALYKIKFDDFGNYNLGEDLEGEMYNDYDEDDVTEIMAAYDGLVAAFKEITGGLWLTIMWAEAVDRGDEVDGAFWSVEGVYDYTEAGNRYKTKIVKKRWNVFG